MRSRTTRMVSNANAFNRFEEKGFVEPFQCHFRLVDIPRDAFYALSTPTICELTGVKEDKDNFIQKALKVCKVFKVKPLKTPRPDVLSKKTAYNLFCREIRKTKKELQGVPVSKASAIISKEWKKVKASEKKMKKYKDLYEEEKQRHEEALQRCQEDHMDEMEIINLHKRCNKKARKVSQPKKALSKSDEPKKASGSPKSDEPKKASGDGKKVKKTSNPKK